MRKSFILAIATLAISTGALPARADSQPHLSTVTSSQVGGSPAKLILSCFPCPEGTATLGGSLNEVTDSGNLSNKTLSGSAYFNDDLCFPFGWGSGTVSYDGVLLDFAYSRQGNTAVLSFVRYAPWGFEDEMRLTAHVGMGDPILYAEACSLHSGISSHWEITFSPGAGYRYHYRPY
jgi:hypothetical protein